MPKSLREKWFPYNGLPVARVWYSFTYSNDRLFIGSDVFNDRYAVANTAIPAGFAGFVTAERFISNADLNKTKAIVTVSASPMVSF
ncbi:MAG: hypothetical protein PVH19_12385 [Planctomycetia bacterium]|jgi:hypothetical protein